MKNWRRQIVPQIDCGKEEARTILIDASLANFDTKFMRRKREFSIASPVFMTRWYNWRPPRLSELTPMIFNTELTRRPPFFKFSTLDRTLQLFLKHMVVCKTEWYNYYLEVSKPKWIKWIFDLYQRYHPKSWRLKLVSRIRSKCTQWV